jgi:hypothetical protein
MHLEPSQIGKSGEQLIHYDPLGFLLKSVSHISQTAPSVDKQVSQFNTEQAQAEPSEFIL